MQRILTPARVIFVPIAVHRLTGIWSRASRVFVPFGLSPVSVGFPAVVIEANRVRQVIGHLQPVWGVVPAARLRVYCSRSQVRGAALGRVVVPSALFPCCDYIIVYLYRYINSNNAQIYLCRYSDNLYMHR